MLVATSVQQSVAYVLAVVVAVGAVLWLIANTRRAKPEIGSEVELAPNRKPYYSDEEMEGKRLDSFGAWALVSLTIVAVGLPLYWLAEPGRQSGAIENFDDTFAHRGEQLSLPTAQGGFNCQGCHGGVSGGQVEYNITDPATGELKHVLWKAPSLDDVALRMTDEQLTEVLTYGRPFSPMPAWGLEGGGPMNEQQISNLVAWLKSIAITRDEATKRAADAADEELKRLEDPQAALAAAQADLASATDDLGELRAEMAISELEAIIASGQQPTLGAALFNINCARCHTGGWSFYEPNEPASGAFGPPLSNELNQFPDAADQIEFVGAGTTFGQKYGRQGKSSGRMPYFNKVLTKEQIAAIVEYERQLATQDEEQ